MMNTYKHLLSNKCQKDNFSMTLPFRHNRGQMTVWQGYTKVVFYFSISLESRLSIFIKQTQSFIYSTILHIHLPIVDNGIYGRIIYYFPYSS